MSTFSLLARRLPLPLGSAALLGLSLSASPALAQNQLNVDLYARGGVSTNPFLENGSTPNAFNATIGARPSWISERPLTTLRLDGNVEATFYDQGYGTNESASVQGSATHRLSEYTTINAALGYVNTIVGSFNGVGGYAGVPVSTIPAVTPATPATDTVIIPIVEPGLPFFLNDPSLGAIGRRRQTYQASGGISTVLSPRDQLSASMSFSANRGGGGLDDFNYTTPSVAYSRALGERFSVGATLSVGFSNYLGRSVGDATIYQPALTISRGFTSRWTLTASLGAAIVDTDLGALGNDSSVSFNGSASLCRGEERWSACLTASRQTVPSFFQGVRTQTSAGGSLGYRLSANDDLAFNANYSRADEPVVRTPLVGARSDAIEFVNATGSYSRRIGRALWGNIVLGYAKAFDNAAQRDANLTALAGVTYRLGRQP
jgi:hypothetical protein